MFDSLTLNESKFLLFSAALRGTSQDTEKTHQELEQALGFYRDRLDMHFQKISGQSMK